jgi:anti-sigma factor ChrR (cupin superfamily)
MAPAGKGAFRKPCTTGEPTMSLKPELNADCNAFVLVHTQDMDWEPTGHPGVSQKLLERVNDPEKGRETALLRFEPGAALPAEESDERIEFFVLEGTLDDEHGSYGLHTFIQNPPGFRHTPSSRSGCVVYFKRRRPFRAEPETERMVVDTEAAEWQAFPHRSAKVLHLYKDPNGIDTRRFGEVFANAKIPNHDHPTGEEVFIVKGCLIDDAGAHRTGTWMRVPTTFTHAPYTADESCRMFIREGDNYW